MPLYEFECPVDKKRTETILSYDQRDAVPIMCQCGERMQRLFPKSHRQPDGLYSYAPNVGSERAFERRQEAIRNGERVYRKVDDD